MTKNMSWLDVGAGLFLILICLQLLTLLFYPSIVIMEDNKVLVLCELGAMSIFTTCFWVKRRGG